MSLGCQTLEWSPGAGSRRGRAAVEAGRYMECCQLQDGDLHPLGLHGCVGQLRDDRNCGGSLPGRQRLRTSWRGSCLEKIRANLGKLTPSKSSWLVEWCRRRVVRDNRGCRTSSEPRGTLYQAARLYVYNCFHTLDDRQSGPTPVSRLHWACDFPIGLALIKDLIL
jgi:hypothetical protein